MRFIGLPEMKVSTERASARGQAKKRDDDQVPDRRALAALEAQRREALMAEKQQRDEEAVMRMIKDQQRSHEELRARRKELEEKTKQDLQRAKQQKLAALSSAAAATASACRSKSANERKKFESETRMVSNPRMKRSKSVNERRIIDDGSVGDSDIASARKRESHASLDRATHLRPKEPDPRPTTTVAVMGPADARRRLLANLLFLIGAWDRGALERFQSQEREKRQRTRSREVVVSTLMRPAAVDLHSARVALLETPSPSEDLGSAQAIITHADVAVLVVLAAEACHEECDMLTPGSGEIWQQAVLIRASGVRTIIVAIDGMDDPRISWRRSEFEALRAKIDSVVHGLGLCETFYVPISNIFRSFLKERHVEGVWFTGKTLLELIADSVKHRGRVETGAFARQAMTEKASPVFLPLTPNGSSKNVECDLEGFVQCGAVRPGWRCVVMPSGHALTVREIVSNDGCLLSWAPAGERVRMRFTSRLVASPSLPNIALGDALCCGMDEHGVQKIKVALQILDAGQDVQITAGFRSSFSAYGGETACELSVMFEAIDLKTGTKLNRPDMVGTQSLLICSLHLARPLVLGVCTERSAPGHFVLRTDGALIAVGWVVALARDVVF